jgi:hypothetical protein
MKAKNTPKRYRRRTELLRAEVADLRKELEAIRLKIDTASTPSDESEDVNVQ